MSGRFDYVKYDDIAVRDQENAKHLFTRIEQETIACLPDGRAKSLALTKLEECYMWIGKGIRDAQVARGGDATHQPARGQ